MSAPNPNTYRGIIPPLVTPLLSTDALDVEGLARLIDHVLAGGVHGLFILGSTGEGPSLSYRLRREFIEHACRLTAERVPVFVGITDAALVESQTMAAVAADAGASAVVAAPPFYYPAGQPELLEHFHRLIAGLPLPLMLYNMPALTKIAFAPATVAQLMQHPNVVGIKDSSGDMNYLHQLIALGESRPDWSVLVGPETLLPEAVMMGAAGGVNGGANLWPRLYVDTYEAALAGDLPRVRDLHRRMLKVGRAVYQVGRFESSIIKGIKCALSLKGICSDTLASPFTAFAPPEREELRHRLTTLDP